MKTAIYVGAGVLGLGALYMLMNSRQNLTPAVTGGPQGARSSSPSTLFSFFQPQAARADNNPALNNQPYAQKPPKSGGAISGIAGWGSAAASIADALKGVFGNTASDSYGLDFSDMDEAGATNFASDGEDMMDFSDMDMDYMDSSYDDMNSNTMVA